MSKKNGKKLKNYHVEMQVNSGTSEWVRKFEELKRCSSRIEELYLGKIITGNGEDSWQSPKDLVRNFFRVSYELKETLKQDPTSKFTGAEVEKFCTNSQYAGLGIDIANQTKHGFWNIIWKRRKTNKKIGVINSGVHIITPDQNDKTEVTIEIDGVKEDCLKLTKNILIEWEGFISNA